MTTYVKIASANYPTHYQSFQFSSHLQYNTLLHSPSQVFYNERNSWYFSPVVINESTDSFAERFDTFVQNHVLLDMFLS